MIAVCARYTENTSVCSAAAHPGGYTTRTKQEPGAFTERGGASDAEAPGFVVTLAGLLALCPRNHPLSCSGAVSVQQREPLSMPCDPGLAYGPHHIPHPW